MGPRFFKRGECARLEDQVGTRPLQWGHASSSVERFARNPIPLVVDELQWGHASSSVESASYRHGTALGSGASMGPRFFKRGEMVAYRPAASLIGASMGPRFFKRGEQCTQC